MQSNNQKTYNGITLNLSEIFTYLSDVKNSNKYILNQNYKKAVDKIVSHLTWLKDKGVKSIDLNMFKETLEDSPYLKIDKTSCKVSSGGYDRECMKNLYIEKNGNILDVVKSMFNELTPTPFNQLTPTPKMLVGKKMSEGNKNIYIIGGVISAVIVGVIIYKIVK